MRAEAQGPIISVPNARAPLQTEISNRANRTLLIGLTLIELLAVISIIALLPALLMAALTREREQAKAIASK